MRTFIAIELPEDVKAKIFHAFEKLKESNLVRGKFVEKDNLHLTLKFIGEVPIEKLNEIEKTLENLASKFKNFSCSTGKTPVFPVEHEKFLNLEAKFSRVFSISFNFSIGTSPINFKVK